MWLLFWPLSIILSFSKTQRLRKWICFLTSGVIKGRRRWEDNIKMDLQEVGGGRRDWMELAQDRDRWRALVGTVRNFRVP
jgi:hypothetical protein